MVDNERYNIKNSSDFINFIKIKNIPENFILISLDVESLFTNIKIDLAIEIIIKNFERIESHTRIPQDLFIEILYFCLKSGYFLVDGKFYKQMDGIAMGSPLSPIIADIIMEALLDDIMASKTLEICFVKKYVDDLILCIPNNKTDIVFSTFNNNKYGLKFTIELEQNRQLPYLDTLLTRTPNGNIISIWHQKIYTSNRILNFNSYHPKNQIINTAFGFINRVMKLTTDENFDKISLINTYLLKNDYPKFLISKLINKYNTSTDNNNILNISTNTIIPFKSICYVHGLTPKLSNILNKFDINCKIIFYADNSLKKILFTPLKDKTPTMLCSNLIYKIPCIDCNLYYIGTTKQLLKNRISGHKTTIKQPIKIPCTTSLAQHVFDLGHTFDFDNTKILCKENKYYNRMFLEMLYISSNHKFVINKRTDTENLSNIYSGIVSFISKI